ncbi:Scr1 family TA system antitoxin-like transcriptional regulator [Streptosporangium sp. NPDC023963]|uniref:Scr1 family TA system antitoxin-like transcriptional regulator n=1 Tax=Streptosporangium sp. NPDC023963 TaxID=3155608 RepID=UPI00342D1661
MIEFERDRPIWIQVAETLTARIESGQYPPRHLIPSEVQMVQEFGIARGTARKVVAYLRERGVVYTGCPGGDVYVEARDQVENLKLTFERLSGVCLSPEESAAFVAAVRSDHAPL